MTDDEIDAAINGREFRLTFAGIGWAQVLNDGHRVALLRQHHSLDPMPPEKYFGAWKPGPWYIWMGVVPDERPWNPEVIEWTYHSGPYRTRKEAMAVALTS